MFIGYTNNARKFLGSSAGKMTEEQKEELAATAARMAALQRLNAIIEVSADGQIISATQAFGKMVGVSAEALAARPFTALLTEAERSGTAWRSFWDQLCATGNAEAKLRLSGTASQDIAIHITATALQAGPAKYMLSATQLLVNPAEQAATRRAKEALDTMSGAIMMVNRDFIVTQINKATVNLLNKNRENFRKVWPNFEPDKIIGMCIDSFHRNPAHQREMMANTARLPFSTDITIGDLKFALYVTASHDENGVYDGNILEWQDVTEIRVHESYVKAMDKSQAVIEFTLDGRVITANANFLSVIGYTLDEIRGQHHSMFVEPDYRNSVEYRAFWEKLGRGDFDAGQYKRLGKGGKAIWLQASYNPVLDRAGKPFRVVKFATDITAQMKTEELKAAVAQVQDAVRAAENNDLTRRVPLEGKTGEIAILCSGLNGLLDSMESIVTSILDASETISTGAREIAMGNTDLSQRTEEQASSLAQTASSLSQLTTTVRQNADNAQQANKLATSASDVAIKGGNVVSQVVNTMEDINAASRKISEIIGVIDEIAFQTNILALNAAVEAARAGDQGRGFAVVAAEVRNLAQRSANAAKEIKSLIADSGAKVETGAKLVATAGNTMEEIVTSVKRVSDIMAEISAASKEQSSGIDQVNVAVSQMDKITQQNAALVEEAAAAAKSMEEQTIDLNEIVSVFQISRTPPDARSPAAKTKKRPASAPAPSLARKPAKPKAALHEPEEHDDWKEF